MENKESESLTFFDKQIQNRRIQMLKAAIPYINHPTKKPLSFYVKAMELLNTIKIFSGTEDDMKICSIETENNFENMLNDIRPYCNKSESEIVDQILTMINTINLYKSYNDNTDNPIEDFNEIFTNYFDSKENGN